jgi:diguanylate cyclase (GGDEF)-like protein
MKVAEKRARFSSLHDGSTELPNAVYFRLRLERALARAEPPQQALAVFLLSLNLQDLKPPIANTGDDAGDDAGDELRKMIAGRLGGAARAEDMLSRLGRNEFACLVPGLAKRDQLRDLANLLLDVVSIPCKIGELHLCVQPSLGISIYPRDGSSVEALLTNAEVAMYRAKQLDCRFAFVDEA